MSKAKNGGSVRNRIPNNHCQCKEQNRQTEIRIYKNSIINKPVTSSNKDNLKKFDRKDGLQINKSSVQADIKKIPYVPNRNH